MQAINDSLEKENSIVKKRKNYCWRK